MGFSTVRKFLIFLLLSCSSLFPDMTSPLSPLSRHLFNLVLKIFFCLAPLLCQRGREKNNSFLLCLNLRHFLSCFWELAVAFAPKSSGQAAAQRSQAAFVPDHRTECKHQHPDAPGFPLWRPQCLVTESDA